MDGDIVFYQFSRPLVEKVLEPYRPHHKPGSLEGTLLVDFQDRATANLRMVNLNQLPGVKATVYGE